MIFRRKKAQAILEFVLVSIPFFILFMGILQVLHIAVVKILVNHAVFVTARVAMVDNKLEDINVTAQMALPFKDKDNISVDILSSDSDTDVDLEIVYNMSLIFPFINKVIKDAKNLPEYKLPIKAEYTLPKESFIN